MEDIQRQLRAIPSMDKLLALALAQPEMAAIPHAVLVRFLRQTIDEIRRQILDKQLSEISAEVILAQLREILGQAMKPSLKRVINATGVVLHTNLGRAPLSARARERLLDIAEGYSTLEYDVTRGERGSRYSHVASQICALTGAEAAIVVNNNAAAVMLVLSALACGREVIVSRGQLVEIGGSFRVPDVLRQSGAFLIEVGTTNKTHNKDYEQAIGPNTAAILKVHTSNYRIIGFTAQPSDEELVQLAHRHNLPVIDDLGSGTLVPLTADGWREPTVNERLVAGVDVVTFSCDKLFGGAQAGIIAGKKEYIARMQKHPLLRAIRIDKLCLAAIEGTLLDYAVGDPLSDIPVQSMLHTAPAELEERAQRLAADINTLDCGYEVAVISIHSQAGGGALPAANLDGYGVSLKTSKLSTAAFEEKLRNQATPVIVRIYDDQIIFDVRCLSDRDLTKICDILASFDNGVTK